MIYVISLVCLEISTPTSEIRSTTTHNLFASPPGNLIKHAQAEVYNIVGMTPDKFTKTFTGQAFDYNEAKKQFKMHCMDYMDALAMDTKSFAVEFAAKMIYLVGPELRKVKPGQVDKTWRFVFTYEKNQQFVFVSTYKTQTYNPSNNDTQMVISVKQASLLAMETLVRICSLAAKDNCHILTPLAGAIFSRDDMEEIASIFGVEPNEAAIIINSSCQSGGQYLPQSNGSAAIVAAFAATRNLKDDNLKRSIVTKITKQYLRAQKSIDKVVIMQLAYFVTGGRLRQTTAVQHEICLSDPTPFREPPRRYSEEKRLWINEQVKELLINTMIEPIASPFSSAIVVAGKKDGHYRFCIDYRRLNDQTVDVPQCLPRIYDILKDIGNVKIVSSLDLKSGYGQIPLAPESRKYTAFSTPSGEQYQFRVMPFGLKNAPSTFQNLMRHVLAEQWGRFAIAYLDDIIVYSQTWEEHLLHLSLVVERLEIYRMTGSPTKCSFFQTSLPYLGHIINETGNSPQPKHLDAILNAEPPRTRKALQYLIGTMNWLGEYIPHYSELISPMTDLLSPKRAYRWTKEDQESLEKAKVAFSNHLPLSRLDPSLPFILQTDASAKGLGAVLMQQEPNGKRRIISYASAKFSPTQVLYHCNEQECLAIIWAIKRYRAHLEDQRFILQTDSKALTWLKNQKDTRTKLTRWHLLLSEYTFDIKHCPGKENELPDDLSRFLFRR